MSRRFHQLATVIQSAFKSLLYSSIFCVALVSCSGAGDSSSSGTRPPRPTVTPVLALPNVSSLHANRNQLFWFNNDPFANFVTWPTAGGPVTPLTIRMGGPSKLALSGEDIFWTEGPAAGVVGGIQVKKVTPRGEVIVLAAEQNHSCAHFSSDDLVVDVNSVYYVAAPACSGASPSRIVSVPLNNDPPVDLITTSRSIWGLSADTTTLYWIETDNLTSSYEVKRVAKAGGSAQTLFSGSVPNNFAPGIAIGNGRVFFSETTTTHGGYRLREVSTNGGTSAVLFETGGGGPVQSIVADAANVYWADKTTIQTIPGGGGTVSTLVTVPESFMAIALSGNSLYWMETRSDTIPQSSTINRISTSGGVSTLVQQGLGYIGGSLVVGNGNVYWTEGGSTLANEGYGKIAKGSLSGGNVQTVASGIISANPRIIVTDQFIYIADKSSLKKLPITGGFPELLSPLETARMVATSFERIGFATDGTAIYFKNEFSRHFVAVPVNGSQTAEIASDPILGDVTELTVLNGNLYWLTGDTNIKTLPVSGGITSTLLTTQHRLLNILIADITNIFFIDGGPPFTTINKMPLVGGAPTVLVPQVEISRSPDMTQDNQSVYWTNQTQVVKASKRTGALSFYELAVKNSGGGIAVDDSSVFWIRDDILYKATPK